jgi:hypothetical protein
MNHDKREEEEEEEQVIEAIHDSALNEPSISTTSMSNRARVTAESVRREEELFYYKTLDIMEVYYSQSCPLLYRDSSPLTFYFYLWVFIFQHERSQTRNYRRISRYRKQKKPSFQRGGVTEEQYHPVKQTDEFDILSSFYSCASEPNGQPDESRREDNTATQYNPIGTCNTRSRGNQEACTGNKKQ